MPLNEAELGVAAGTLQVSKDSGYLTSHDLAGDTLDPLDSAPDIEAASWVTSYKYGYEDPTLALTAGTVDASTNLDLFQNGASAKAFVDKQLDDADDLQEKVYFGGFEVINATKFDITGGDGGFGLKVRQRYGELSANVWVAGIRIGGLVATVNIARSDGEDVTSSMQALVSALEQRVRDVIYGGAQITPLPLPTPEPDAPGQAARPEQGPFLDAMALTISELPKGSTLDEEGYVPVEPVEPPGPPADEEDLIIIGYERSFNLGPRGSGGPFAFEADLELWPTEEDAATHLDIQRFTYSTQSGQDAIAENLDSLPFDVTNVSVHQGAPSNVGDDSLHAVITYRMALGNIQSDFVYVRVGRVIGTLIFTGFTNQTDQAYIDSLMQRFVALIQAGLQSG
jgi:hypothetical protein